MADKTCKAPKLAAFDLDGTLLDGDHKLSPRNREALRKLEAAGCTVVLSSGRSFEAVLPYWEQVGLKTPVICYNGAMIRKGDEVLHEWRLPAEITRLAHQYARERDMHFQFFQEGQLYYEKEREETEYYEYSTGLKGKIIDMDAWPDLEVTKALMIMPPSRENGLYPELDEAREHFKGLFGPEELYCALSKPFYLEFINGSGSKGHALDQVCRDMNIRREDCAAFGDGFNDLEMLDYAGCSVAMLNAPEGVKERCRRITDLTNDEDGVADFIEKNYL